MTPEQEILRALAESVMPCRKDAAAYAWPSISDENAGARLSRVLSGELAIPPRLLAFALRTNRAPLLACLARLASATWAPADPTQLRSEALRVVRSVRDQLELFGDLMAKADEAEGRAPEPFQRRGPVRVQYQLAARAGERTKERA